MFKETSRLQKRELKRLGSHQVQLVLKYSSSGHTDVIRTMDRPGTSWLVEYSSYRDETKGMTKSNSDPVNIRRDLL